MVGWLVQESRQKGGVCVGKKVHCGPVPQDGSMQYNTLLPLRACVEIHRMVTREANKKWRFCVVLICFRVNGQEISWINLAAIGCINGFRPTC